MRNIPKIYSMQSPNGNDVPNQFEIRTEDATYFQSYDTIIAMITYENGNRQVFLDQEKWDYSVTTGKYRNQFLGDSGIAETRKRIKSGEYKLIDLN